jgi:very-short-patch-repair endonuclease
MLTGVFKDRTRSRLGPPRTPDLVLGKLLQSRSLAPAVFQRRASLGPFVVDYVCLERGLVVELDDAGRSTPGGSRVDARARFLSQLGFRVLRLRRAEVLEEPAQVIAKVRAALRNDSKSPSP